MSALRRAAFPTAAGDGAELAASEDAGAAICIGIAFVPVAGTVVAAICGLHNAAIRAASRVVPAVATQRHHEGDVRLYRGGFCR